MSDQVTFTLSIEPVDGASFVHGFHLGTIETIARDCARKIFSDRNMASNFYKRDLNNHVMATRTVALIRHGKIFDVYDGQWSSEADWPDFEAAELSAPFDDYASVERE
jgi:hypothetical protein